MSEGIEEFGLVPRNDQVVVLLSKIQLLQNINILKKARVYYTFNIPKN